MSRPSPTNSSSSASVQVVVRLRPLSDKERKHGTLPVVSASTADKTVTLLKGTGSRQTKTSYRFDNVFTAFSSQEEVFDATLKPVIRDVLMGYESTVFAYGQTGTGKTHTMEGDLNDPNLFGVIPRSAAAIFETLQHDPEYVSSSVHCSFLEIYNEELCDLLVPNGADRASNAPSSKATKLAIMEGKNGPFCRGLSECRVESAQDLLILMRKAQQQRQVGETNMNKQSSRSHCIFTLRMDATRQLADGSVLEVEGKLHCVDLAGSECAKSADMGDGADQQQAAARERERMNINRSLLTLGRVVSALKEQGEHGPNSKKMSNVRIPYRDSKLTRILQESLGGRCKTCLIATISPSVTAIEESMSTLNYAQAANGIVNKPVTTSSMSVGSAWEASSNKLALTGEAAGSVEHWSQLECRLEYMQSQVEEAQQALARKHIQQVELVERAEKAETALQLAERNLEEATHRVGILEQTVEETTQQLSYSRKALRETTLVLEATQHTEVALTEEAEALLATLKETVADGDRLHDALLQKRQEEDEKKSAAREFHRMQIELLGGVLNELKEIGTLQKNHRQDLESQSEQHNVEQLKLLDDHIAVVARMKDDCEEQIRELQSAIHNGMLPALQLQTSKIRDGLKSLEETFVAGHKGLQAYCQAMSDRMNANASHMKELELQFNASSTNLDATLAQQLHDSIAKLSKAVTIISDRLEQARSGRNQQRDKNKAVLNAWWETCRESFNRDETLSNQHSEHVNSTIEAMTAEGNRRHDISNAFIKYAEFVDQKRNEHMQDLERQNAIMKKQHAALLLAHSRQQQMNATMIANVMKGMQDTMSREMNAMAAFQDESYGNFVKGCDDLTGSNDGMNHSVGDTFTELHLKSKNIGDAVEENFKVQVDVANILTEETIAFDDSRKLIFANQREKADEFIDQSLKRLEQQGLEDSSHTNLLVDAVDADFKNQTCQLLAAIQDSVKIGLSTLNVSTSQAWSYMNQEVIESTKASLENDVSACQVENATQFHANMEEITVGLADSEAAVTNEVNRELEIAALLKKCIEVAAEGVFAKSIDHHKETIHNSRWLETSTAQHEQLLLGKISNSCEAVTSSSGAVDALSCNVIRIHDETPTIEKRNVPTFTATLTKTPLPDEILKNSCGGSLDDAISSHDTDTCKENSFHGGGEVEVKKHFSSSLVLQEKGAKAGNTNRTDDIVVKRPAGTTSHDDSRLGHKKARVSPAI